MRLCARLFLSHPRRFFVFPQQIQSTFEHRSTVAVTSGRCRMNSLHEISAELIQLYKQQLASIGVTNLDEVDFCQYERRQERIERLYWELEALALTETESEI